MCGWQRLVARVLALAVVASTSAAAQTPTVAPCRRSVAIGAAVTPVWVGRAEVWPAARVSVPLGSRFGVDLDAGVAAPAANGVFSSKAVYALSIRILRPRRTSERADRYWILGSAWIAGRNLDDGGRGGGARRHISAIRLGYGGAHRVGKAVRVAGEVGVVGGGSDAPTGAYATVAVQWLPFR